MYKLYVTRDYEEDDRKRRRGDRSSYSGPTSSFTEKRGYKPEVRDYSLKKYISLNRSCFFTALEELILKSEDRNNCYRFTFKNIGQFCYVYWEGRTNERTKE